VTTKAEKIGAALAKAVKASTGITSATLGGALFRTNIRNVPRREGLPGDAGPIDLRLLIDNASAGADNTLGWSVLKPGARHGARRARNCDAFFIVLKGHGHLITETGREPSAEGDVVYCPRGVWHGFANTSNEDAVLLWGLLGAGSIEAAGVETSDREDS
jgi:mannose-6-phosphate isomerase-like protein (cupin superfamily)